MATGAWKRGNLLLRTGLVLLFALLSSCSSIKLAYGQLDWWLRWQLDDYLDLRGAQKLQVETALDQFHQWHRQTQLPLYADHLEQLAGQVASESPGRPQLLAAEERVEVFYRDAAGQLVDLLLPLLAELDEVQIDQLAKNLEREREKGLKKAQKPVEKRRKRRIREARKQGRRWLGDLSEQQEQWIVDWAAQLEFDPLLRDRQRQLWQTHFVDTLRQKPAGYRESLRELLLNPQQLWPEDYAQMREQRRQQTLDLSEKILSSTTPTQRQHLAQELRRYAADFRSLSAN